MEKDLEIPRCLRRMPGRTFLSDEKLIRRPLWDGALPITRKNILGIVGLAVIALFWVAVNGLLGGAVVAVLIVLAVIVLNAQRRKRNEPQKSDDDMR